MATKQDVQAAIARYNRAIGAANRQRARDIARFADLMPQKDIIEATGYSRETVRRLTEQGRALAVPARPAAAEES